MELRFADETFAAPEGWQPFYRDERVQQRDFPHPSLIFCETVMAGHGDIQAASQLVLGPWTWWRHGRSTGFCKNSDGSTSQVLSPVWWNFTRIGVQVFPGQPLGPAGGIRMPIRLTRHFLGPASIDIYPNPSGDGIILRGRYHGVEDHVPLVPRPRVIKIHLGVEAGNLNFPFPRGTGYTGLLSLVDKPGGGSNQRAAS